MGTIAHQHILHSNHQLVYSSQPFPPDRCEGDQGLVCDLPGIDKKKDIVLTIRDKLLTIA